MSNNKAAIPKPELKPFEVFVGEWKTEGEHGLMPGTILTGKTSFKWMEGGAFLLMHSTIQHEKFPDGIGIIGSDNTLQKYYMLYFDERGISRKQDVQFKDNVLRWWRTAPGFSQRYTFSLTDNGNTMLSKGELSTDDITWEKDLNLTYSRIK